MRSFLKANEAELHVIPARMRGGLLSKARRGELHVPLPIGFVYDAQVQVDGTDHPAHCSLWSRVPGFESLSPSQT